MAEALKGQAKVIDEIRRRVDAWRGYELGRASDPYPQKAARYEPVLQDEHPVSSTTLTLLHHWFRSEPHLSPFYPDGFKYWPHQRRTVETFIYLYEVLRLRRTEQLYQLASVDTLGPQRDPWPKLGAELATGSGKTKIMSLMIAWSYLNAVCEPDRDLGVGRHTVLIAPGLFVRDRLLQDFLPEPPGSPVFFADPVVPPELETFWRLRVYSPTTCPRELDPAEGALVVTNYHQLLRTSEEPTFAGPGRQIDLLFRGADPRRLEDVSAPLIERFNRIRGLVVINDEAHHVWDEPGHAKFESQAKARDPEAETSMAWIRSIRGLNGSADHEGRVGLQIDLSATLFQEAGAKRTRGSHAGARDKVAFRQPEWFRHTAVHYGLADAIKDGIVKKPILERVEVRNKKTGDPERLVNDAAPNAWQKYRNILHAGIERWKRVRDQLAAEGDPRKPILFIISNSKKEANEVANYLTHGEATETDLSYRPPEGFKEHDGSDPLFLADGPDGEKISTVLQIHIGEKEERNEDEWDKVRRMVNAVDRDEIQFTRKDGTTTTIPNPYNVVVSVMMLKEGWDVRNVKVIVPLRPCDSRTLTEQTLGRGLRKMHAPVLDEDGGADLRAEELYVIEHPSFQAILSQIQDIIEERASDDIEHTPEYLPILQKDEEERPEEEEEVRIVRFEGLRQEASAWTEGLTVDPWPALTPRLTWQEEIAETEIHTYLKEALKEQEEAGLVFELPKTPTYRDFDHVIELGYVIPLLKDLRVGYQHKVAVKALVREYLEKKTFSLPAGLPISFDRVIEGGNGLIALGNLARGEVIQGVRRALLPRLQQALAAERSTARADLVERSAADLGNYQTLKANVIDAPRKTTFDRAAMDSDTERRVALLLDDARDVVSWLHNHRRGVGFYIEYPWQGYAAKYFPDFIVRARHGSVFHNYIVEVKGRLDERDKRKAEHGRRYCAILTEHDREPWHYIILIENDPLGRNDVAWWEGQSVKEIAHLRRRHEGLPLYPEEAEATSAVAKLELLDDVPEGRRYVEAIPVYDLAVAAGAFSETQSPEPIQWARVRTHRPVDSRLFVARTVGRSMEPGIPDGSWGLFRFFPHGSSPMLSALDGRRLVVQLREHDDPETGGAYTLKRFRVADRRDDGGLATLRLDPDNPSFDPITLTADSGELRVIAEFLEVVG